MTGSVSSDIHGHMHGSSYSRWHRVQAVEGELRAAAVLRYWLIHQLVACGADESKPGPTTVHHNHGVTVVEMTSCDGFDVATLVVLSPSLVQING